MTEEQLRDVLARVVPEPPDSVADPAPVVRAARRQQRVRVVGATGLAAVLVAGTFLGLRAVGDDDRGLVVDRPATSPTPTPPRRAPTRPEPLDNGAVADLDGMTAVRYCTRPSKKGLRDDRGPG